MRRRHLLATAMAFGPMASLPVLAAPPPVEQAHTNILIRHVELQKGLVFVRDGGKYTCEQAAKLLRGKTESMGQEVGTAREFIERIATRSSMSGEPCQIRLADGTPLPAGRYLIDELKRIESQPA